MTQTIRAIKLTENSRYTSYSVMAAHAGRRDRTGGKVHMASITIWHASGRVNLDPCACSANGRLKGTLVAGNDDQGFGRVTCRNCGTGEAAAAHRNAASELIEVNL